MSTRIRYATSDLGEALKKSIKLFGSGKRKYYVVLNEDSMHYIIFDADSKEVVSSGGNTTNKTVLRLQAKKALEKLGVKFEGESRSRNKQIEAQTDIQPEESATSQPESEFVRRDEVMSLIENKVKELLTIVQGSRVVAHSENQAEKMVG